jgi:hypothetical protein
VLEFLLLLDIPFLILCTARPSEVFPGQEKDGKNEFNEFSAVRCNTARAAVIRPAVYRYSRTLTARAKLTPFQ